MFVVILEDKIIPRSISFKGDNLKILDFNKIYTEAKFYGL